MLQKGDVLFMEYQRMNEQEALAALYDSGGRAALERISELRGVDYCLDKQLKTDIRIMTANLLWARWDATIGHSRISLQICRWQMAAP